MSWVRIESVGHMSCEDLGLPPLNYDPCRYDGSRLLFRGPQRTLEGEYIAFLGGTETFGKFIPQPFPDLVEDISGVACVNFGWPNAGIDVFAHDRALLDCAGRARLTVLQVPCAVNMSNAFYNVHPRRNDRFLCASATLRSLFDEVDFTEFSFTRHMLSRLQEVSPDRFAFVRQELSETWVAGMQELLDAIASPVILLWLSKRRPEDSADSLVPDDDPALVSRDMLNAVLETASGGAEVVVSQKARDEGTEGMAFSRHDLTAAAKVLRPMAHREAAEALIPVVASSL